MEFEKRKLALPHLETEAVSAGRGAPGSVYIPGGFAGTYEMVTESGLGQALSSIGRFVSFNRRFAPGAQGPLALQSLETNAFDLMHVMDAFELEKPHLLGGSYGASVALTFAWWCPQRVSKLVLLNPTCITPGEHETALNEKVALSIRLLREKGVSGALADERFVYSFSSDRSDLNGASAGDCDAEDFATMIEESFRRTGTSKLPVLGMPAHMLRSITHETLVFSGSDADHPPQAARALAELMPNVTLSRITTGSSGPMSSQITNEIVDFLTSR